MDEKDFLLVLLSCTENFICGTGIECELSENTLTFCFTPFSSGDPNILKEYSGELDRSITTFSETAIPPIADIGSIRAAIFTSSPKTSLSDIITSPWWRPMRMSRLSILFDFS